MPSSLSLQLVVLNVLALPGIGVLWWKGYAFVLVAEILIRLTSAWKSSIYHACLAEDITWCPDSQSLDALQRNDVQWAFLSAATIVSPLLLVWVHKVGGSNEGGAKARALFLIGMLLLSVILVDCFGGGGTMVLVVLSVVEVLTFLGILAVEVHHLRKGKHPVTSKWWYLWLVLLVASCAGAGACYLIADTATFNSSTYQDYHNPWHILGSCAQFFAGLLLPRHSSRYSLLV